MRKLLQVILQHLLLLLLLCPAFVASAVTIDGLSYSLDSSNKTASVSSPCWVEGDIVIPSEIVYSGETYSVTSIGFYAFAYNNTLTSATIPNSVIEIGTQAFFCCSGLKSVTIPNSVIEIGTQAFLGCSALTSVTIPNSVSLIEREAFCSCGTLIEILVETENQHYSSEGGVLFNIDKSTLMQFPAGKAGEYTIPNSVTSIEDLAFYCCNGLTSVTIPDSVTSIGEGTFFGCSALTSATIGNSVTEIGFRTFYGCSAMTSVTIGNSVTEIGWQAFMGCRSLMSVSISSSVTSIDVEAFSNCRELKSVTVPASVISIGSRAFFGCRSLTEVYYDCTEPIMGEPDIFIQGEYATLYVPEEAVEKCKITSPWCYFDNIQAHDFSGIEAISADINVEEPYEVYDLRGIMVGDNLAILNPGVYIIRHGDTVKKIMVK